jgi:hypothetical protein
MARYAAATYQEAAMIALFKGMVSSIVLTWVVALVIGSNGSKGGFLFIKLVQISGASAYSIPSFHFYWSWPLFFAATVLGFFIFQMLD